MLLSGWYTSGPAAGMLAESDAWRRMTMESTIESLRDIRRQVILAAVFGGRGTVRRRKRRMRRLHLQAAKLRQLSEGAPQGPGFYGLTLGSDATPLPPQVRMDPSLETPG